jgi:hypothetical protein
MKNKYWAIALGVLVLVLVLVSACGGKSTTTATATSTKTATATTTATSTATATTTATATKTATATGGSLSNILGLGAGITSVKYDMSMTTPGTGTIQMTVYDKNNKKFREEMTTQGITTIILIDSDAGVMYMYMPDLKTGTKTTLSTSMVPVGINEDPNTILQYNPQITGTETIDGKSCTVMTWTTGTDTMKEWIWTDKGFPVKMEMTTSQGTSTIEYKNIDFSNIPDSKFEVPSDIVITTVGG